MTTSSRVHVGRTKTGYLVRVEGQGTMRASPLVHAFARQALDNQDSGTFVIDLSACQYLDSTFLGCLVDLHRRYSSSRPPHFSVIAPDEVAKRLFGSNHLDRLLVIAKEAPEVLGEELELSAQGLELPDQGQHLLDCHRRLAEIEGPNQAAFQRIADRLADELEARRAGAGH